MAKIKNLRIWETLRSDSRITVSSSLFGLRTTVVYQPTGSVVDARLLEYTPADGERLKKIFEAPRESLISAIGEFHPTPTVNGNYIAEVCVSRDQSFVALQLSQFVRMSYEPVTEVLTFEGDEALLISELF